MHRLGHTFVISVTIILVLISESQGAVRKYPGLRERADEYLMARVGDDYFRKHFKYVGLEPYPNNDPTNDQRLAIYAHEIQVGEYRQDVRVVLWLRFERGEWKIDRVDELPDCSSDESKCMPFHTTKDDALKVASEAGAFEGALRFSATIHYYHGEIRSYVWGITTYQTASHGKSATVSLSEPKLLQLSNWYSTHTPEEFDSTFHQDLESAVNFKPK